MSPQNCPPTGPELASRQESAPPQDPDRVVDRPKHVDRIIPMGPSEPGAEPEMGRAGGGGLGPTNVCGGPPCRNQLGLSELLRGPRKGLGLPLWIVGLTLSAPQGEVSVYTGSPRQAF